MTRSEVKQRRIRSKNAGENGFVGYFVIIHLDYMMNRDHQGHQIGKLYLGSSYTMIDPVKSLLRRSRNGNRIHRTVYLVICN